MRARISLTELRRDLAAVLDRVRRRGDSFLIEEDGEAVAALEPATPTSTATWSTLAKELHELPRPDVAFAADLEEIQRHQPEVPTDVWRS